MFKSIKRSISVLLHNNVLTRLLIERIKFEIFLRQKLKKQLSLNNAKLKLQSIYSPKKILIPYLESSHYQYLQILILAKALQLRGAEVKVIFCGSRLIGCELKNIKNSDEKNVCFACKFSLNHIVPMFGLDVVTLDKIISDNDVDLIKEEAVLISSNYPDKYIYKGIDIIPMVNDSVVRFYYGAVPLHEDSLKRTREQHLASAMIGIIAAERLHGSWMPDIILNNMFVYSSWEPYHKFFEKIKKELFLISMNQYNFNSIVLNIFDVFKSSERYHRFKDRRKHKFLDEREKEQLASFISARLTGDSEIFKQLNFFNNGGENNNNFKIDRAKRNIFLFSNIYWDAGMSEHGQLFNDVVTWVLETISLIKENDKLHLYIKIHPGEKYDSAKSLKGIADFINEKYPVLPRNIIIISPDQKVKPYDLFPYIDLGVVFNGTIGIEMLLKGIPVVIAGKAPYGRLGLVNEPVTIDEYRRLLYDEIKPIIPDKNEIDLFCYFYFIKVRMPWNLTEKAYNDNFKGYAFNTLDDILPGENNYLDHLCNCILDSKNTVVEGWD